MSAATYRKKVAELTQALAAQDVSAQAWKDIAEDRLTILKGVGASLAVYLEAFRLADPLFGVEVPSTGNSETYKREMTGEEACRHVMTDLGAFTGYVSMVIMAAADVEDSMSESLLSIVIPDIVKQPSGNPEIKPAVAEALKIMKASETLKSFTQSRSREGKRNGMVSPEGRKSIVGARRQAPRPIEGAAQI